MPLEVAIPDTALNNLQGLREKTTTIGRMARAFAIFRVSKIIIYETGRLSSRQKSDVNLLIYLLRYMDTPQYLRRRIFPHSPLLRYAGTLPPLRIRSHPLESKIKDLKQGDIRWGIQVRPGKIDLGLDELVAYKQTISETEPTLFRILSVSPRLRLEKTSRDKIGFYFGFEVHYFNDIISWLKDNSSGKIRIGFSRHGVSFTKIVSDLQSTFQSTESVIALFGGPYHGLTEILQNEKGNFKDVTDFWINSVPNQGTETVRLEEALLISLGLLNTLVNSRIAPLGYY